MEISTADLFQKIEEQITFGNNLIEKLHNVETIEGVLKLQRKIRQEIQFLKRLQSKKHVKLEQLCCTNLCHLGALVESIMKPGVLAVCKSYHLNERDKLVIDIISDEGRVWTKVIARNPKSLSALSHGKASYGARSVLDQAEDYLEGAHLYPCFYKPPKIVFEFVRGIEEALAKKLKNLGILVKGEILPNFKNKNYCDIEDSDSNEDETDDVSKFDLDSLNNSLQIINSKENKSDNALDTLNLDVTAMMAYISNMTNGFCHFTFKQPVLTQQAEWEAQRPVRPVLEKLFEGKKLMCCQTAWDEFEKIVKILGGPMEKNRARELKKSLTILSDDTGGEDDCLRQKLNVRGHVRLRSKIIFNFGHRIKALTVSANEGFVRAAQQQGVTYAAFIHESRALTEGKEDTATKITS